MGDWHLFQEMDGNAVGHLARDWPRHSGAQADDIGSGKATSFCDSEMCFKTSGGSSTETMSDSHNDWK
jgi:hypothetical protein